jgi:hypothetical protein
MRFCRAARHPSRGWRGHYAGDRCPVPFGGCPGASRHGLATIWSYQVTGDRLREVTGRFWEDRLGRLLATSITRSTARTRFAAAGRSAIRVGVQSIPSPVRHGALRRDDGVGRRVARHVSDRPLHVRSERGTHLGVGRQAGVVQGGNETVDEAGAKVRLPCRRTCRPMASAPCAPQRSPFRATITRRDRCGRA